MEFRILGSLELFGVDGAVITDPPRQQRRAICTLVLHAGQRMEPAVLADLIWSRPPSDGALRTCLYEVRRLIGDERLVYRNGGYRFVLQPSDRTDIDTFRTLVAAARRALEDNEVEPAARLFAEALGQWRDPVLRDLPDTAAARTAALGLVDERRRARDSLVMVLFELGRVDELIGLLESKVGDEPLNEEAWRQLMLALYRGGRPAEALHAFERARTVLEADADTEPGAALRQLRGRIQDGDPALSEPEGRPTATVTATAATGHVLRLRQLPPDVPNFTGRTAELAQLQDVLTGDRSKITTPPVAVITGLPGAGKTSLAVRVARMVADAYPDGQAFVQLAGSSTEPRDPRAVLGEILRALGAGPALPDGLAERAALFRSELAGRRILLVADDAASFAQIQPLLPGAPECAVIVTSRYQSVSPAGQLLIQLDRLTDIDALELLAGIIGKARVDAEPDAAAQLVASCGLSPLAVRIAGARLAAMKTWPVAHMAGLLTDPARLLDQLKLGDLAVRQVIDTGYVLLDQREQAACRRLALLGPHDVAGWLVAVLLGESNADDVVDRLVDTSLLQPVGVDVTGEPRYRLHDLVRAYATERLADDPDREVVLERLLAALLELTDMADAQLPRDPHYPHFTRIDQRTVVPDELAERLMFPGARAWLEAERLVVLATIFAACEVGRIRLAIEIALRMDAFMQAHGYRDDAANLWRTVLSTGEMVLREHSERRGAAPQLDGEPHGEPARKLDGGDEQAPLPPDAALVERVRYRLATLLAANRAQPDQALPMLDRCIAIFERVFLQQDLSRALYMRGYSLQLLGRLADARRDACRALEIARQCADRWTEALTLSVLGLVCSQEGQHEQAREYCGAAVAISHELGAPSYEALILYRLVHVEDTAGHYDRALELCKEGVALADSTRHGLSDGYFNLKAGHALCGLGRHREAVPHLQRALPTFLSQGASQQATARCRRDLAEVYLTLGDHAAARPHFEQCVPAFRALGLAEEERHAAAGLRACAAGLKVTRPNVARIYDYLLGGKENFAADRAAAEQIEQNKPRVREAAQSNRAFLERVVRFLVFEAGIRQFIDIGTGLPTEGNVHEIVHTIAPDTRTVYVDNDLAVVAHAGTLLTGWRTTTVIEGDLRRPEDILADSRLRDLIDFSRPVAVLLLAILHFISDDDNPRDLVARLTAPLPAGSYLAISHATADDVNSDTATATRKIYSRSNARLFPRGVAEVTELFGGLEVVDPGVGWITRWRPHGPTPEASPDASFAPDILGGVAYKRTPDMAKRIAPPSAARARQPR